MKKIIQTLEELKNTNLKSTISQKDLYFSSFKNKSSNDIFSELCFCVLTANFNAQRAIDIQNEISDVFINGSIYRLKSELRRLGYRFPNKRAEYIVYNRQFKDILKTKIFKSFKDDQERREWIVKNIKGISYKEASHFLRNIGFKNYAIIDFHIIDILIKEGYLKEKPKTMNKKKYLYIEKILHRLGEKVNLNQSKLDFYLWYIETGKVLK
jgi:N-glycosylase/DNA lyase